MITGDSARYASVKIFKYFLKRYRYEKNQFMFRKPRIRGWHQSLSLDMHFQGVGTGSVQTILTRGGIGAGLLPWKRCRDRII